MTRPHEAARAASARWAKAALFAHPPAVAAAVVLGLPLLDGLLTAALVVVLPLLAVAQLPLVRAEIDAGTPLERVPAYLGSAVTVLALGALAWLAGLRGAPTPWLRPIAPGALLGWSAALLLAALAVMLAFHGLGRWLGVKESPMLRALLPRTGRERRLFVALSLAAGVGEEVAFRGYLLARLAEMGAGPWWGALAAAVPFAAVHAYQGAWGVLRTGLLGAGFAAGVVLSGSLWPAVLAHVAVDLVGGLWLGPRLLDPPGAGGPALREGDPDG